MLRFKITQVFLHKRYVQSFVVCAFLCGIKFTLDNVYARYIHSKCGK